MSSVPNSWVTVRFFKVMVAGFRTKLTLPPAYCKKLKGKLPERAIITSSRGKWRVAIGLCSRGNLCFLDGWASFVKEHDLKIGNFVVFEQTGHNHFEAIVFDSSLCTREISVELHEEESSAANVDEYAEFARINCGGTGRKRGRPPKMPAVVKQEVFPSEVLKSEVDLEPDLEEYTKRLKRGRGRPRKNPFSPEHTEPSMEIFEEKPQIGGNLFSHTNQKRRRGRPRKPVESLQQERNVQYNGNHDKKEFPKKTSSEKKRSGKYDQQHGLQMSKILPNQSSPDKQDQFQHKIMSYNLGRSSILYIPAAICRLYCISEETKVSLIGPSREWHDVEIKKHSLARLCFKMGWREFCASNNLELGDVCDFKIIKTIKSEDQSICMSIIMDVQVFKACS